VGRRTLSLLLVIGLALLGLVALLFAVGGILWLVQTVLNAEEKA
jgi:hypothetical protein